MSTRDLPDEDFSSEFPPGVGRPANAALVAHGITTLDQVAALTQRELLAIHGVGPKAVKILRAVLAEQGRDLAG